jgi:hypothetical protein
LIGLGHRVHVVLDKIYQAEYFIIFPLRANGCGHQLILQKAGFERVWSVLEAWT